MPKNHFDEDTLTGKASRDFALGLGGMLALQILILVIGYYNATVLLALFAVGVLGLIAISSFADVTRRWRAASAGVSSPCRHFCSGLSSSARRP